MSKCDESSNSMEWVGWIGVAIAVVFFGSNFIPVKKFDTGDGNTSAKLSPSLSPSLLLSRDVLPVGTLHWDLAGRISREYCKISTSLLPAYTAGWIPLDYR